MSKATTANAATESVDLVAIGSEDGIVTRGLAAGVADRQRRNAKDRLFDKCIRRRIRRRSCARRPMPSSRTRPWS